jgi:hypothetical protein
MDKNRCKLETRFFILLLKAIYPKYSKRDGTVQLFRTKEQKFLPCPGTKGQRDKLKILPRDGIGRDFDSLSRPGTSRGTEMKEKSVENMGFFFYDFLF